MATMDISQITPRVFVSSWPREGESCHVADLGIRLVISMTRTEPLSEYLDEPLEWVHAPSIDSPFTPIPLGRLRTGVEAAIPVLARGGGVLCHCREGRHRSVAMACCILIAQGCSAEKAMDLVEARRAVAEPRAFWIAPRIRKFEREWRQRWSAEIPVPESAREAECT
jgi:protein-tyrosine phosphatase